MATNPQLNAIVEAGNRGILNQNQVNAALELQRRGKLEGEALTKVKDTMRKSIAAKMAAEGMGAGEKFLVGTGRGLTDVAEGIQQTALESAESLNETPGSSISPVPLFGPSLPMRPAQSFKGSAEKFTREAQEEREIFEAGLGESGAASAGRFTGNVLPTLAVPGGAAGNILTRAGTAGLAGAGIGGTSFVPEGGSRTKQALTGGLFGTGGSLFLSGLGRPLQGLAARPSRDTSTELVDLSRQFNVPLTVGEVRGSPGLQALETQLERVPGVGLRGFREGQSESLKSAAEKLKGQFDAGCDDVGEALQKSLNRTLETTKKRASQLYDRVENLSQKAKQRVFLNNTDEAAKRILSKERELRGFSSATSKSAAERFKNNINEFTKDSVKTSQILDKSGKPITEVVEAKGLPFTLARKLRSRFNAEARKLEKQVIGGSASDEELAAFNQLRSAFERDISDFAQREGGSIEKAYRQANEFYRKNVVPFKERQFRRVLSDDFDTDNILATFIKRDSVLRGRGNQAEKLVGKLDLEGKQAVKFAVLSEAYERAVSGDVPFSPAKFAQEIKKLSDANKVIFSSSEKSQLDGFVKLAEAAKRAGQYAENPPTGLRAADLLTSGAIGASFVANPAFAAGGLGATKAASLLLSTEKGRRILERISKVTPGNRTFKVLSDQANSEIARILASRSAAVGGQEIAAETE